MSLTTKERAARALETAKNILLTDGWSVGEYRCEDGKHCAVGAVRAAVNPKADVRDVHDFQQSLTPVQASAYVTAVQALAEVVSSKDCRRILEDAKKYKETPSFGEFEEVVVDYNDSRVVSNVGRNAVLRKFDKAVETLRS